MILMSQITYTVRQGDTLFSIAQRFGVSVNDIVNANNIPDPDSIFPGQNLVIPVSGQIYVVQPGDTLFAIAQRFDVTVDMIVRVNDIPDPSQIFPGQRLVIPTPAPPEDYEEYIVQPGDTVWNIARRFGTTIQAIARANNLDDPSRIDVGQVLRIPVRVPDLPPVRPIPIFRGNPDRRQVAFTFDATYGNNQTPRLLSIMDNYDIKATFFLSGIWPETYPGLARDIAAGDHEFGNHSYDHPIMTELTRDQMREQITRTTNIIQGIPGADYQNYFRPPFGEYDNTLLEVATDLGYYTIMWTVDSLDWQNPGVDAIIDRVLDQVVPGAIILMHQAAHQTPDALPTIIETLFDRGYTIGTVTNVLTSLNYE